MKRIALLGCGTVGSRVAELLERQRERLAARLGDEIDLAVVLVRDSSRDRGVSRSRLTSCIRDVADLPRLDAAIEVLGGVDVAGDVVERLLRRGVGVVTANKSLLAHRWEGLHQAAQSSGAPLRFEASVGGAMPLIRALGSLAGDRVERVRAVISGSCNFILNRVGGDGWSFGRAVDAAREAGLLEPDPSADLSGRDVAEKLSVITALTGQRVAPDDVDATGIDALSASDFEAARPGGRRWRLVAEWSSDPGHAVDARERGVRRGVESDDVRRDAESFDHRGRAVVAPRLIEPGDPLHDVPDAENVAVIDAEHSGRIVVRGPGAGPAPTAATILGDLLEVLAPASRRSVPPTAQARVPIAPTSIARARARRVASSGTYAHAD